MLRLVVMVLLLDRAVAAAAALKSWEPVIFDPKFPSSTVGYWSERVWTATNDVHRPKFSGQHFFCVAKFVASKCRQIRQKIE